MPEGDTIHRSAERLRSALAGRTLVGFAAPRLVGDRPTPGDVVEGVEARGKHLLVHFAGGLTLRTHLRMTGSWHLYPAGERWRRARHLARAVIEVEGGWTAVCFSAPVVETYQRRAGEPAVLTKLGPDLCAPGADVDAAVTRFLASDPAAPVADALLDQRIAAGIGNVWKSETLFVCGVDPRTPRGEVGQGTARRLYAAAHTMLRANLHLAERVVVGGGLAVYGRRRQPCRRCGTPIEMALLGSMARSTYWCPTCQPAWSGDTGRPHDGR